MKTKAELSSIKLTESLRRAHRVLRLVRIPAAVASNYYAVGYENGREHGLCLRGYGRLVVWFAENRSSDDIVVYHDGDCRVLQVHNTLTERGYQNAKLFGTEKQAARYIEKLFRKPKLFS